MVDDRDHMTQNSHDNGEVFSTKNDDRLDSTEQFLYDDVTQKGDLTCEEKRESDQCGGCKGCSEGTGRSGNIWFIVALVIILAIVIYIRITSGSPV